MKSSEVIQAEFILLTDMGIFNKGHKSFIDKIVQTVL